MSGSSVDGRAAGQADRGPARAPRIPFIRAAGDPYEIGHQHGVARAASLRAFIDDSLCRLNRVMETPVSLAELRSLIAAHQAAIAAATPALAEELRGLADGAGITVEQATLLQLRREVMGYKKVPMTGGCTTYAWPGGPPYGAPVTAQTIDLNSDLDDQIGVLAIERPGTGRRSLVLSFAGLLGYVGVNGDGLAVGLNLVLGGRWRPGLPPYLAVRHLLDTARSVDDAIAVLRGLPLASSRCFTLCDARKAAYVEVVDDDVRVTEAEQTVHTNHFLHSDLGARDEVNVFARNSSVRRLGACRAMLADLAPDAGVEEHFALLSTPPICVPDEGDIRRDRTVAAVVMLPARGEMHVRPGDPSRATTQAFGLSESAFERRSVPPDPAEGRHR